MPRHAVGLSHRTCLCRIRRIANTPRSCRMRAGCLSYQATINRTLYGRAPVTRPTIFPRSRMNVLAADSIFLSVKENSISPTSGQGLVRACRGVTFGPAANSAQQNLGSNDADRSVLSPTFLYQSLHQKQTVSSH